jgi:hypothetical protein
MKHQIAGKLALHSSGRLICYDVQVLGSAVLGGDGILMRVTPDFCLTNLRDFSIWEAV